MLQHVVVAAVVVEHATALTANVSCPVVKFLEGQVLPSTSTTTPRL